MRWNNRIGTGALLLVLMAGAQLSAQETAPLAPPTLYPEGEPTTPHGSSEPEAGEDRYDSVGYATASHDAALDGGVVAASAALPIGSFAEVTSLDTGRTILVRIAGEQIASDNALIDLSPPAAQTLGMAPGTRLAVRVRKVDPIGEDLAALRAGGAASRRMDAPDVVLKALRKQLPADTAPTPKQPMSVPPAARTVPAPKSAPPARPAAGVYYVQVAALSDKVRAQALAETLGGYVTPGGGLYRIRVGGFGDKAAAEQKRAEIAARGYGDARVYRND